MAGGKKGFYSGDSDVYKLIAEYAKTAKTNSCRKGQDQYQHQQETNYRCTFLQEREDRYKNQDTQVIEECDIFTERKSIVVVSLS